MTPSAESTSQQSMAAHLVPVRLLKDGEVIVLAIKPSGWFVLVSSLPVLASAVVVAAVAYVVSLYRPSTPRQVIWSACAAIALLRMVAACWQWLGRTYVLTNLRIISIRGLLRVQLAARSLSELYQAVLAASLAERVTGTASVYCQVNPDGPSAVTWNTVARPAEIHEIVVNAISRAKRHG